ncbi:hypothetical protein PIN31115_01920 [Pandoraea iniqua]|uniref:Uncharacterized protein n=1 Tax=Pandoraea iniqua TaxID=2508288 RepID=A0A5E4UCK6_9BURK|nr:DUF5677 domain-containing protein [Pandoraea iniqua]VVD97393.1 hypothetical protein PIN31115_01920 [Pandoraea iniqua]
MRLLSDATAPNFLSDEDIFAIRNGSSEWFVLSEKTLNAIGRAVDRAREHIAAVDVNDCKSLVVALLMRTYESMQGVVLLAERRMTVQCDMLSRALYEDAFWAAYCVASPAKFVEELKLNSDRGRLAQVDIRLGIEGDLKHLREMKDSLLRICAGARAANIVDVAKLGAYRKLYFVYKNLCDTAAHTSRSSLGRYFWRGENDEIALTWDAVEAKDVSVALMQATLASIGTLLAAGEILDDTDVNAAALRLYCEHLSMTGDDDNAKEAVRE